MLYKPKLARCAVSHGRSNSEVSHRVFVRMFRVFVFFFCFVFLFCFAQSILLPFPEGESDPGHINLYFCLWIVPHVQGKLFHFIIEQ